MLTMRSIILCAIFGATAFAGAFFVGLALTAATGIPIMSAVANGVIVCFLLTIGVLATRAFGATTLMMIVYGSLAIPTALLGPPGIHKIVIAIAMGLGWDAIAMAARYKPWAMPIGAIAFMLIGVFGVLGSMYLLGLPGIDRLQAAIAFIAGTGAVSGCAGSIAAAITYQKRLRHLRAFQLSD